MSTNIIEQSGLVLHRQSDGGSEHLLCIFNFSDATISYAFSAFSNEWVKVLDSKEPSYTKEQRKQQHILTGKVKAGDRLIIPPLSVAVYKSISGK